MTTSFDFEGKANKVKRKMTVERMKQISLDIQKIINFKEENEFDGVKNITFASFSSPSDQLLSQHASRSKQGSTRKVNKHLNESKNNDSIGSPQKLFKTKLDVVKNSLSQETFEFLLNLFDARCSDLEIGHNQQNWSSFLRTFLRKNSAIDQKGNIFKLCQGQLNCSQLNLKQKSLPILNEYIRKGGKFQKIDFSQNLIDPNKLSNLFSPIPNNPVQLPLKNLILNNCALGNQQIQALIQNFIKSQVKLKVFSLSSPDVKDRNQLTKYGFLKQYIIWNESLQQLYLSNIQIKQQNPIFEAAKHSKSIRILDLSKNTDVCGMCKNLSQLNLSRNDITDPSPLRLEETSLTKLDLSFNNIVSYKFQMFLLVAAYPSLKTLILDGLPLNFQIPILQQFLQRSGNLSHLSIRNSQLSAQSFLNVCLGLQKNGILQFLDLSGNKFPASFSLAEALALSLETAKRLQTFKLAECELRDQYGCLIFKNISKSKSLVFIDVSKNLIGSRTSTALCDNLKKSFYNLMRIQFQQNFVKYDHTKQLKEYVKRNQYLFRVNLEKQRKSLSHRVQNMEYVEKLVQQQQECVKRVIKQKDEVQDIYYQQKLSHLKRAEQQISHEMKELAQLQQILERELAKREAQYDKILEQGNKIQKQGQQERKRKTQESQRSNTK